MTKCSLFLLAAFLLLPAALSSQQSFPAVSTVDEPTIAGRPVALDTQYKLLPWPMPDDSGYSYSSHFLSQWTIVWDQFNRQRLPYFYCCFDFDRTTYELTPDPNWVNSTGYLRAMMQGFIERLYPYTGDPHTLEFLQNFVDYELENGTTPENYAWSQVPYPSANPGSRKYTGWSNHGEDFIEPHVVGEDGYAYLRLYEMTGNTKYLRAAIRCAAALVKNFKRGDEKNSPWPFRCLARNGALSPGKGLSPYSANVVEPIMLFDELIRIGEGDVAGYKVTRAGAWAWLMKYPMKNNVWVGYFEDVGPGMENRNNVIPLELARYVLLHPEKDPDWREHARKLIEWVKTTPRWPKYIVHGAMVTTEQGSGKEFCCNLPNQCCDSHTARLAAAEAFYYAKTGDAAYKEAAYRSYNWVTYFQGLPGGAHAPFTGQWWWTDQFADGPRRLMDAFWAVPEWAPSDESHLLGGLSPVTKISYRRGSVTYSTFDKDSTEVLRLAFVPKSIMSGGRALPLSKLQEPGVAGYSFNNSTHVLRVHHTDSRDVDIQGASDVIPPKLVTFDDPHLPANTILSGPYPSYLVDWGANVWKISAPFGKFGTFHLTLANAPSQPASANASSQTASMNVASQAASTNSSSQIAPTTAHAEFRFLAPRLFLGIDIYNDGPAESTITISSPETQKVSVTLKPNELRRLRTNWQVPSSKVTFDLTNPQSLHFDNLAYQRK
jgi:hypothetical protein